MFRLQGSSSLLLQRGNVPKNAGERGTTITDLKIMSPGLWIRMFLEGSGPNFEKKSLDPEFLFQKESASEH